MMPSLQKLVIDGVEIVGAEYYNINDENYFKLRDIAALLSGTAAQFEVVYDKETNAVLMQTGEAYTPVGGELEPHADRSASILPSPQSMRVDGENVNITAYNLEGNNFFRLRDLGRVLGFDVDYDLETNTAIIRTAAEEAAA